MDTAAESVTPLRQTWQRLMRSAGVRAAHLQQSFARLEQLQAESQRKGSQPNVLIASVVEVGLLLVMAAGVSWAVQGSLNVAVLAAVTVMLARFAEPLSSFISFTSTLDLMETALERIEALLAVPPLPQLSPGQTPLRFDIAFEGIDFAYASGCPKVLSGFSATLPAHSMTAFVGPSGGGKTTVTRLLMRHADAQAGSVRIGGVDVRHIAPETLNRLISVVFQDVYLFDDTVLANIRMARPEATDEEVRQAARAAQCLDFIERLPQGWHTRIGEAGGRLSGGERQRISIAPVIIDEAFGKADNEYTALAMNIFANFGFQMIIATPLKSVMTLEPYIGGACFVTIKDRRDSAVLLIEYDDDQQRLQLDAQARAETETD